MDVSNGVWELVGRDPMGACCAKGLGTMQAGTLLFVGVALTVPAQIAGAATQLVTHCNDAAPGSRRQAVLHVTSVYSVGSAISRSLSRMAIQVARPRELLVPGSTR